MTGGPSEAGQSSATLEVPAAALPYILYQRTQHLDFIRSPRAMRAFLALDRLFGGDGRAVFGSRLFRPAVRLEAMLRGGSIRRRFADEIAAEFERLRPHLAAHCRSILDVGSGVAGIDAPLYHHYAADSPRVLLLDRTSIQERIFYGFERDGAFYNSLDVARDLLRANGVPDDRIVTIEAAPDFQIAPEREIDLALSLISWGFHYPVATYLDRVHALLAPGGRLILDVRRGTGAEDELRAKFSTVRAIEERPKHLRLMAIKAS